jgi:hypothetical protein
MAGADAGVPSLPFGKHRGKTLREAWKEDPAYLKYLTLREIEVDDAAAPSVEVWCDDRPLESFFGFFPELAEEDQENEAAVYAVLRKPPYSDNRFYDRVRSRLYLKLHQWPSVVAARAFVDENNLCYKCFGRLVPIGTARANGANHGDWAARKLHKKCFRSLIHESA